MVNEKGYFPIRLYLFTKGFSFYSKGLYLPSSVGSRRPLKSLKLNANLSSWARFPEENVKRYHQILGLWPTKDLEMLDAKVSSPQVLADNLWPNLQNFPRCFLLDCRVLPLCPMLYLSTVKRISGGSPGVNRFSFCQNGGFWRQISHSEAHLTIFGGPPATSGHALRDPSLITNFNLQS